MAQVNFSSLSADASQEGNMGGFLKVAPVLAKFFTGNWPIEADIVSGEITVAPRVDAELRIPVYELPANTIDAYSDTVGEPSFQTEKHTIEFMAAGFHKRLSHEFKKFRNAGAVYFVQTADLKWGVVGTSYKPIYVGKSQKFGKKGGEKRGTTFKGEEEGYNWEILTLSDTVVADLNFGLPQIVV